MVFVFILWYIPSDRWFIQILTRFGRWFYYLQIDRFFLFKWKTANLLPSFVDAYCINYSDICKRRMWKRIGLDFEEMINMLDRRLKKCILFLKERNYMIYICSSREKKKEGRRRNQFFSFFFLFIQSLKIIHCRYAHLSLILV